MGVILSCDPGVHGALALRVDGKLVQVEDMPTYKKKAGARGAERDFVDEGALWELFEGAALMFQGVLFVVEDVCGLPGQSAPRAFTFGRNVGAVLMAARACGFRLETIKAARWKQALRVPADKSAARVRASELMPESSSLWPLKKHDGRAEAAMLGLYAEKFL